MKMTEAIPRRLIKFGNSSYIVSLPKDWISKHRLKKGDLIHFSENSDNELIISSKKPTEKDSRSITINVDGRELRDLKREVTSAYINNYDEIILEGQKIGEKEAKILNENIGIEVFEQTPNRIILKDILDFEAISIEKMLRRLDNIIKSIFEDLKSGLQHESFKDWILKEIIRADAEINKVYFLLLKIIRKGQEDSRVASKLKTDSRKLSDLQWVVIHMEHLGDELKRIAKVLNAEKFNSEERKNILLLLTTLEKGYADTLSCYYSYDKESARKIAESKEEHLKLFEKYLDKSNSKQATIISEKMKWIALYIHNFAKIVAY